VTRPSNRPLLRTSIALAAVMAVHAADPPESAQGQLARADSSELRTDEAAAAPEPNEDASSSASADRKTLNLLGEVDTSSGESRRNENVRITLVDNAVLRELNERLGASATVVKEFTADRNYFGSEFGGAPSALLHLTPNTQQTIHGNLHLTHNNSVFSARSFFQVGGVKPARTNNYGFSVTSPLGRRMNLTVDGSQNKVRGNVNGNILVPRADERTPFDRDPATGEPVDEATKDYVRRIMAAYPGEAPNRPDIDPRALNTNSPQSINGNIIGSRLDIDASSKDQIALNYKFTGQTVEAFQLVGGQNPDTTTKNHRANLTWSRTWNANTTSDVTASFSRIGSLLLPDETAVGPLIWFASVIQFLGPGQIVPIDRARNTFQYGGQIRRVQGRHTLHAGANLIRRQVNGFETNSHRGEFQFRNDFGRDALTNLRLGRPSTYSQAIGDIHRGFRTWDAQIFLGDQWQATGDLTINLGLRYQPALAPIEVNGLSEIPYDCDCNNWAPRFGFAYRLGDRWGVLRGAYGIQYGEVFPVTYSQARFNPPQNLQVVIQAPRLADPLSTLDSGSLDPNARSTVVELSPDMVSPYSHQYNFSWEFTIAGNWRAEFGYVGSRSIKLLNRWNTNRAQPVPGIPLTTRTVNQRRPDPRYFEVRKILNSSRGYYDAAKVRLIVPSYKGLTLDTSYWFSKAIDLESNYTGTGSSSDAWFSMSQSEFNAHAEMRGLSTFDQPHAFLTRVSYQLPRAQKRNSWLNAVWGGWQLSSIVLLKSGTPFTVAAGSDGPGFGNADGAGRDRPHITNPSILGNAVDHPNLSRAQLPASAFAFIAVGETSGSLGRNTFRKDSIANINGSLSRSWPIGSEQTLLFRAESINFFNTPQFAEPGRDLTSPNFGRITNTLNDGRTFRFLLRLAF